MGVGATPVNFRVGSWEVDPTSCCVRCNGSAAKLNPRTMDVLVYLAEHADRTITHDELLSTFWRGGITSTNAVHKCVAELRHVLGNGNGNGTDAITYIETIPKRGYHLVAPVERCASKSAAESPSPSTAPPATAPPPRPTGFTRRRAIAAVLTAALLCGAAVALYRSTGSSHAFVVTLGERSAAVLHARAKANSETAADIVESIRDGLVARLVEQGATVETRSTRAADVESPSAWRTDYAVIIGAVGTATGTNGSITMLPAAPDRPSQHQQFTLANADEGSLIADVTFEASEDLAVLLDDAKVKRMRLSGTQSTRAYRLAQEGNNFARIATLPSLQRAIALYQQSIAIDPTFAGAYLALADAYWMIAQTPPDTTTREQARQDLQALLRDAKSTLKNEDAVASIDRTYRFVSASSAFDAEALWRSELLRNPNNIEALVRYSNLLVGARLIAEGEQYLQRALDLARTANNTELVEELESHLPNAAIARGQPDNAIRWLKLNVERWPDFTLSLYGLVAALTTAGRHKEAEAYLTRLKSTDAVWGHSAEVMMQTVRGALPLGSQALEEALADPRMSNTGRGRVCFVLGDVARGVAYWREIEPARLVMLWQSISQIEPGFAPGVIDDPRYRALLDELGIGDKWRRYARDKATELTPVTGIAVTTPL